MDNTKFFIIDETPEQLVNETFISTLVTLTSETKDVAKFKVVPEMVRKVRAGVSEYSLAPQQSGTACNFAIVSSKVISCETALTLT